MKMKKLFFALVIGGVVVLSGCNSTFTSSSRDADRFLTKKTLIQYDELTMDLDPEPIIYTIDISTTSGKAKLAHSSLSRAKELVLVEAIMENKCATIFQPQYTHLEKGGKVLRVTVYGYPARYKKK